MKKIITRKIIVNKNNKQMNISIPKKNIPKKILKMKGMPKKVKILGFEW
jgi:hypothetical protein